MTHPPRSLEQDRQVLAAARQVLTDLGSCVHQVGGDDLAALLGEVDALAAAAGGVRCQIVFEPPPAARPPTPARPSASGCLTTPGPNDTAAGPSSPS